MEISHIIPVPHLENKFFNIEGDNINNHSIHMILTHLVLKNKKYRDFYKQLNSNYILDNSLIELGQAADLEKVVDASVMVKPMEIILPDVWMDYEKTMEVVDDSLAKLYEMKYPGNTHLVVQGRNEDEWKRCFEEMYWLAIERGCVLGIPKNTHLIFKGGRPKAVEWILDNFSLVSIPLHLLGCWKNIVEELEQYNTNTKMKDMIRSMDSSIVFHCTIEGMDFEKGECVKPNYTIDLEKKYENFDSQLFLHNINYIKEILK